MAVHNTVKRSDTPESKPLTSLDIERIRRDFPILQQRQDGQPLVYLDNAATSQKPQAVLNAVEQYYATQNANVHRGVHHLSQEATDAYEGARKAVKRFIHAPLTCEIIYTRGTTEAINLVAQSYGREHVREGDEVLLTWMEHHSNIVPWQMLCEATGATLRVVPIDDYGALRMDQFEAMLSEKTRIVAVTHVSNALGTINPIADIVRMSHNAGAKVLVDGAQAVPHLPVDVHTLGCDFYVFSGHKMCGPTGIGILFGKADILDTMPPYQGGGDMIMSVTFEKTTYNTLPHKFEAGTPNIAGAIGLGEAVEYLDTIGMERIAAYEEDLVRYGTERLTSIEDVRLIGTAPQKAGVLSFYMENAHPHDIGQLLDGDNIAIRAGHHCAQPVMERFGVPATARASLAFYNTTQEIDALVDGIEKVKELFG